MTIIGTITDEASLAAFEAMWSQKVKQPRGTKTSYRYSFALRRLRDAKQTSVTWVYNPEGFTKPFVIPDIGLFPVRVYRIPMAAELNRLVGIE